LGRKWSDAELWGASDGMACQGGIISLRVGVFETSHRGIRKECVLEFDKHADDFRTYELNQRMKNAAAQQQPVRLHHTQND